MASDFANGLVFDAEGNLYLCQQGGHGNSESYLPTHQVARIAEAGGFSVIADSFDSRSLNSPNDLALDGLGGIYFTDPRYGVTDDVVQDVMGVYYVGSDGHVTRVVSDIARPNGILVSNDGLTLYVSDAGFTLQEVGIYAYPISSWPSYW